MRTARDILLVLLVTACRVDAQCVSASITFPPNGAANANLSQPIQWTSVAAAQAYYLYIGTTVGAKDLVDTGELQRTSFLATNVPAGRTVYARMWTEVAGSWCFLDSAFSAAQSAPATAVITYPVNGAVGADLTQPIQWTSVANVQAYYLYVGTAPGSHNLVNTGELQRTSFLATNLPANQTLYARMWTEVGGVWRSVDSSFVALPSPAPAVTTATMTSPADGAGSVPLQPLFRWTTVANAQAYYLYVGSAIGAKNVVDSGETQLTSYMPISTLFEQGQRMYARLWTKVNSVWQYVDSTFTLTNAALITYPLDGDAAADLTTPIQWTPIPNSQAYFLYLGTTPGASDIVYSGETSRLYYNAATAPTGRTLYARMWTKDYGGIWRYTDSSFVAAAAVPSDVKITFSGFGPGPNPLGTYHEAGFTVSSASNYWTGQSIGGFPGPFLSYGFGYTPSTIGTVQVVADGQAAFTFESVDVYGLQIPLPYTITGLRNSVLVFRVEDTLPNPGGNFRTVVNPYANDLIDTLVITLTDFDPRCSCSQPIGIDNISLKR